jgi:hypothetical protein
LPSSSCPILRRCCRWIIRDFRRKMEDDFIPIYSPNPPSDMRIANAAEYSAYHLGQLSRNLARLIELLEEKERLTPVIEAG